MNNNFNSFMILNYQYSDFIANTVLNESIDDVIDEYQMLIILNIDTIDRSVD